MKALRVFLITILAIVIVVVGVLGYFGFMPGVSNLFGSNKPKDLGVTFTTADYQSARNKIGTVITDLSSANTPEKSIKFSGQKSVNTSFTQAEFTAELNNRPWKYYPFRDCQFKINPDGSGEFSAILIKSRLEPMAKAFGATDSEIKTVMQYIKYLPGDPAIYVKCQGAISNNRIVGVNLTEFQVGKINFTNQIKDNQGAIISWMQNTLFTLPGVSVKSLKLENGKLLFEGTLPDVARAK
jgi:hypothetical protein